MQILLADDERNFGNVLKQELEEEGFMVDLASDGVEAVLKFLEKKYDFVLLDIRMPRLDGISALRIVKKINPAVPALTFSGNAGSGEVAESLRAGAVACFTKPFEVSRIETEIRRHAG